MSRDDCVVVNDQGEYFEGWRMREGEVTRVWWTDRASKAKVFVSRSAAMKAILRMSIDRVAVVPYQDCEEING